MTRPLVILLMLFAIPIAACSPEHTHATSSPTAVATSSPTTSVPQPRLARACASRAPLRVPSHQRTGTDKALVPGRPIALLACRYHGSNKDAPVGSLATTATLPAAPIAQLLNTTPDITRRVAYSCPADHGEEYDLYFSYATGAPLMVRVDHGGCTAVTNGDRNLQFATASVVKRLEATLGQDHL